MLHSGELHSTDGDGATDEVLNQDLWMVSQVGVKCSFISLMNKREIALPDI